MAVNTTLSLRPRDGSGKGSARKLRAAGRIPGVIYGHGEETRSVSVDRHEFELLFSRVHVENTVLSLEIEGQRPIKALVREVQAHPVRADVLHVDFYQIHAGEKVSVQVPIRLQGTPAGVRAGGMLQHTLNDLPIRCLADAIPETITADVTALEIGDSLHISDLQIPDGVELELEGDVTVCSVSPPTVAALEPEAEVAEGVGGEVEPEVIRHRDEEQAGEAPGA
jgi:large subunit ribosomal protein L25